MDKKTQHLLGMIEERRRELGLSLRKLADLTGVSFATLSRLERLQTEPDESTKARLANWLGTEAKHIGLHLEHVAEVHFRAGKNLDPKTVAALLHLAEHIRKTYGK